MTLSNNSVCFKIPLIEKYTPNNIDDFILEDNIKNKFKNMINNKTIPNMIIVGNNTTCKTSSILYIAKEIYKDTFNENVLELNAYHDRCLSVINTKIYLFCKNKINKKRLIILDDAEMITSKSQILLANLMIKYESNISMVFICNESEQIIESIQSKCIIINFSSISRELLFDRIETICKIENIQYDIDGLDLLLFVSNYNIRQTINNLESLKYVFNLINEQNVYLLIDKPKIYYITEILNNCYSKNYNTIIELINNLYTESYTINEMLSIFSLFIYDNKKCDKLIFDLSEEDKICVYEILSLATINNKNSNNLIQFYGFISKIYKYFEKRIEL